MSFQRKEFKKKWHKMSLIAQLANVGSEVNRALRWKEDNNKFYLSAVKRSLDLLDLTIGNLRDYCRLKEVCRLRCLLADYVFGRNEFKTSLSDLERYFFYLAKALREEKKRR